MSARIPLQIISSNTTVPDYSYSMMYEPYCTCCYSSSMPNCEKQYEFSTMNCNPNPNSIPGESMNTHADTKKKAIRRSKHIPHHLRPQHIVEKRNTRERRRVQDVNQAFHILKALLPFDTTNDTKEQFNSTRISKVRTLRTAVDYIEALQNMLNEDN